MTLIFFHTTLCLSINDHQALKQIPFWASWLQSTPSHPSLRYILILSSLLRLVLPCGLVPLDLLAEILYVSPMCATCPFHLIPLDLANLKYFVKNTNDESSHHAIFSILSRIWGSHGSEYEDGCLLGLLSIHRPDDGGSKDLWNVGKLLPDYTALQPRRQPSSC
jgi:hypothetical protein